MAGSVDEALHALAAQEFDVVVSDIAMPERHAFIRAGRAPLSPHRSSIALNGLPVPGQTTANAMTSGSREGVHL